MKIILINGCYENCEFHHKSIKKLCEYIYEKKHSYSLKNLKNLDINPCSGCDYCQIKNPGICCKNDGMNDILHEYLQSDIAIIVSPIQFGSCNSTTKFFLDRTQPLYLPYQEIKRNVMKKRYNKYPNLIFIGISEEDNNKSIENFIETFKNCTLSLQSNKTDIKIVKNKYDIENFNFL